MQRASLLKIQILQLTMSILSKYKSCLMDNHLFRSELQLMIQAMLLHLSFRHLIKFSFLKHLCLVNLQSLVKLILNFIQQILWSIMRQQYGSKRDFLKLFLNTEIGSSCKTLINMIHIKMVVDLSLTLMEPMKIFLSVALSLM